MILGIDEAGRGSLIGPMIVAGVVLDEEKERRLTELGVRDSKALTPRKRAKLLPAIVDEAYFLEVIPVGPEDIDLYNLNTLTRDAMDTIIKDAVSMLGEVSLVILDRVGKSYSATRIINGRKVKIIMEEKADAKYTVVSAASIVAKVFRDWCLSYIQKEFGLSGSGYPSDNETVEWVRNNLEKLPRWVVRHKWRTLRHMGPSSSTTGFTLDKFMRDEENAD